MGKYSDYENPNAQYVNLTRINLPMLELAEKLQLCQIGVESEIDGTLGFKTKQGTYKRLSLLHDHQYLSNADARIVNWNVAYTHSQSAHNYLSDADVRIAQWDTAYGWGNHAGLYSLLGHSHSTLTPGTGLTGNNYNGSAAATWAVAYGTTSTTACVGNDTRLSDARTPLAHTLVSASHTASGLTTGHFLRATGATTFGFAAHGLTAADVGAAPIVHTHALLTRGIGLTGNNYDGSAAATWAVAYGTTSTTACVGNDTRLSDARTPLAHTLVSASHTASGLTTGHVLRALTASTFGFAAITAADVGAAPVVHTHALLTRGIGLTGNNYDGSTATTWAVEYGATGTTACVGNDARVLNGQTAFGWGNHAGLYAPNGFGLGTGAQNITDLTATTINVGRFFRFLSGAAGSGGIGGASISLPWDGTPSTGIVSIASSDVFRFGWKFGATGTPSWRTVWHDGNFTPANYEPAFTKNTAFNKNFGSSPGTVTEGNDSRVINGQTAFGWGNHAGLYAPVAHVGDATHITGTERTNWNAAFGWGNHAGLYSLSGHAHATLTRGTGLTGNNYTGASATTWAVAYGTAVDTACVGNDIRLSDARTPTAHALVSASHTASGLTTGHFLRALTATTYGFAAHGLTAADVGAAPAVHTHALLTRGTGLTGNNYDGTAAQTWAVAYGTTSTTACVGNDTRLSDARTPLAHALISASHTASGLTVGHVLKALSATTFGFTAHGLTAADVGAAPASHDLAYHSDCTGSTALRTSTSTTLMLQAAGMNSHRTSLDHHALIITDSRDAIRLPNYHEGRSIRADFIQSSYTGAGGTVWNALLTVSPWTHFTAAHPQQQLAFIGSGVKYRAATSDTSWGPWYQFYHEGNFNPANYLLLTGGTLTGALTASNTFVGPWPVGPAVAAFGHSSFMSNATSYAVLQDSAGHTFINAAPGKNIFLRVGDNYLPDCMKISSDRIDIGVPLFVSGNVVYHTGNLPAKTVLDRFLFDDAGAYLASIRPNSPYVAMALCGVDNTPAIALNNIGIQVDKAIEFNSVVYIDGGIEVGNVSGSSGNSTFTTRNYSNVLEITGNTANSSMTRLFILPSTDWTFDNTRILSVEVKNSSSQWVYIGTDYSDQFKVFLNYVSPCSVCVLNQISAYYERPIRITVARV